MFEELTSILCLLKLHVIRVYPAFLANSSDNYRSGCIVVMNVHFLCHMVFRGNISYRFSKSALLPFSDSLQRAVFRLLIELFSIIGRFHFGWDFFTGAVLGILNPWKLIATLRTPTKHNRKPTPNHVFWATKHQNPLWTVVCRQVDEQRRRGRKNVVNKPRIWNCIIRQHGEPLL